MKREGGGEEEYRIKREGEYRIKREGRRSIE